LDFKGRGNYFLLVYFYRALGRRWLCEAVTFDFVSERLNWAVFHLNEVDSTVLFKILLDWAHDDFMDV
jgi:hypothetical protein